MQRLIELLKSAKRPLLHVGQGVRIGKAIPPFLEFVEKSGIPVVTARNGNDLIASDHPCFIGRPGTFAQRGANFAVQLADVYLAVGTRLCLAQTGYNAKDYARNARIIQVDIDKAELNKDTVPLHLKIQEGAAYVFNVLKHETWPDWSDWLARCKRLQAKYPPVSREQKNQEGSVNSYAFVDFLSDQLTSNDIVVTDMGYAFQCTHQVFRVKQGQRLFTNGGTAAMGWGLPAAIGAAIGTNRRVICIVGDGGLMMNMQELATLRHHNLNVKLFILNNDGYLTMRKSQAGAFGRVMGSDPETGLSFPSFYKTSQAFDLPYLCARDFWRATTSHALDSDGPIMCEVVMDPNQDQIPKSINRRIDGKLVPTPIEDAWPHLPPEEIAENLRTLPYGDYSGPGGSWEGYGKGLGLEMSLPPIPKHVPPPMFPENEGT